MKYALSGDVLLGAKYGRLSVHDPIITTRPHTDGCIELNFTELKGENLKVMRSMQLIQKANDLEFKTKGVVTLRRTNDKIFQNLAIYNNHE
jgi:hypothetical protein